MVGGWGAFWSASPPLMSAVSTSLRKPVPFESGETRGKFAAHLLTPLPLHDPAQPASEGNKLCHHNLSVLSVQFSPHNRIADGVHDRKEACVADFVRPKERPAGAVMHEHMGIQDDPRRGEKNQPMQYIVFVEEVALREAKVVLFQIVETEHLTPRRGHQHRQVREVPIRIDQFPLRQVTPALHFGLRLDRARLPSIPEVEVADYHLCSGIFTDVHQLLQKVRLEHIVAVHKGNIREGWLVLLANVEANIGRDACASHGTTGQEDRDQPLMLARPRADVSAAAISGVVVHSDNPVVTLKGLSQRIDDSGVDEHGVVIVGQDDADRRARSRIRRGVRRRAAVPGTNRSGFLRRLLQIAFQEAEPWRRRRRFHVSSKAQRLECSVFVGPPKLPFESTCSRNNAGLIRILQ
eukprot:scaffold22445_cov73-Phaeocystis_antarctica.AAC.4